jgi:4-hydroxybutyrate CoA-transferase
MAESLLKDYLDDKAWKDEYLKKLVSVKEAADVVKSGDRISTAMAGAIPVALLNALCERKDELRDVDLYTGLLLNTFPFLRGEFMGHINYHAFFLAAEKQFVSEGNIDVSSIPLSHLDYWHSDVIKPTIGMLEVTPPDKNGYMSYGPVGASMDGGIARVAKTKIVQVNLTTPRANGSMDTFIHVSDVDYICEVADPMPAAGVAPIKEAERKMAEYIVSEISDGDCLQIGIGGTPDAVCKMLLNRNDIGIHSELVMDGIMALHKNGNITNARKTINKGKIIAGGAVGSKACYDWVGNTPEVELHLASYVNNPAVICQNDNMRSINGALMVDLAGQVNAESFGFTAFSGCGGQQDFAQGARLSKGGKFFTVLQSTSREKKTGELISRVVPSFSSGCRVTTPHMLTDYVVTEFGMVQLRDRSFSERAKLLISIAHPELRDKLTFEAKARGLIS